MPKREGFTPVNIAIPNELHIACRFAALKARITMAEWIRQACAERLERIKEPQSITIADIQRLTKGESK